MGAGRGAMDWRCWRRRRRGWRRSWRQRGGARRGGGREGAEGRRCSPLPPLCSAQRGGRIRSWAGGAGAGTLATSGVVVCGSWLSLSLARARLLSSSTHSVRIRPTLGGRVLARMPLGRRAGPGLSGARGGAVSCRGPSSTRRINHYATRGGAEIHPCFGLGRIQGRDQGCAEALGLVPEGRPLRRPA